MEDKDLYQYKKEKAKEILKLQADMYSDKQKKTMGN